MKFAGIKSLNELLIKEGIISDTDNEFIEDFTGNLKIFPDTLETLPTSIAGPDRDVGIFNPYIEEMGASIKATAQLSKETALSIGLDQGSIKEYIEDKAADAVRNFSEHWDTIEKLFVSSIYDDRVQNAGIPINEIKDEVNQEFRCSLLEIANSEDGSSFILKLEFFV